MYVLIGPLVAVIGLVLGCALGVAWVVLHGERAVTIPHVAAGFLSLPVALVGVTGAAIALTLDPTVVGAAIVTVIIALTAGIVAVLSKLGENRKAARDDAAKAASAAADIALELAKIGHSVNGTSTKQIDKIDALQERVEHLIRELAEAKGTTTTQAATIAATIPAVAAARAEGLAEGVEQERTRDKK